MPWKAGYEAFKMAEAADCFELENYVVKKVENYARFTLIIIRYFIFEFRLLENDFRPH